MPKFLSDLEVQGKIKAASATINDLMVGKLEVSGGGDLCVDSITVEQDSTFKGSANFSSYATFSYNPLFNDGFCITEAFTLRKSGGLLVEKNGCSSNFVFFPDENDVVAKVYGSFCVNDTLTVVGDVKLGGDPWCGEASVYLDRNNGHFCIDVPNTFEIKADDTFLTRGTFHLGGWNDHPTGYFLGSDGRASLKSLGIGNDVGCVGSGEFRAVKLCGTTALGACAYGISVSPTTGLQLWGTHFLRGSVISDDTLKVVHNNISLASTDEAFLGFDYANEVNFWTFPNDGTEATYCFSALQWKDDSHEDYKPAGVRLKKANQVSEISDEDVLNVGEGDQRWLCYDTVLSCNTINIITQLCSLNRNASYGVLFGSVPICPLWVKGDACVQGLVNLRSPLGKYPDYESRLGFGVFDSSDYILGLRTSQPFCLDVGEFGLAIGSSANSFEVNNDGAKFSTCTTFDKDIYTKEKVYLTNLPTYSGSSDPENTSLITKSYLDSRLTSVYSFKGTKAKKSDLNSITTKAKGDVYNVTEDGMNYAWDGTAWDALGGDFSRYYTKTEVDSTFAKTSGGNTFEGTQSFNGNAFFFGDAVFCTSKRVGLQNGKGAADLVFVNDTDKPQLSFKSEKINTEVILDVSRSGTLALAGDVAKLKEDNTFSGHNTFGTVLGGTFCVGTSDIEKLHIFCIADGDSAYRWGNHHVEIYREPAGTREPTLGRLAFCFFGEDGDTGVFMSPSKGGTLAVVEEVYDRATIDGVTTGANVLPKMNEVIGYLEDYEEKTGEKLPLELYEETVKAIEEWQKDPTVEKDWYTSTETESTNPYYNTLATSPVVDLTVTRASRASVAVGSFNPKTNVPIFLPNATVCDSILYKVSGINSPVILPKSTTGVQLFYYATNFNKSVYLPEALDCNHILRNASKFNCAAILPKCRNAPYGFANTAMSAENISKTLDSLPAHATGSRTITFTGSPGAAELNQSSPSVAAAVAKGWTVEL